MLPDAISKAIDYLMDKTDIPADVWQGAIKARVFVKAGTDIASINATYHDAITSALISFFEGGSITAPRNIFKRASGTALSSAFDAGWQDGGQELPPEPDAQEWYGARVEKEFSYIEMLFQEAKELRNDTEFDFFAWVTSKANSYTASVQGVYNAGAMWAKKNKMLTWSLGTTEKHCDTCAKLDGGRKRAAWYVSRNYIPRQAGAAMTCGGYNCDCKLSDDDGNEVTL